MALKITITNDKGVSGNYHRILTQTQSYIGGQEGIYVNLAGYTNATYRQLEKDNGGDMTIMNTPIFLAFDGTPLTQANIYERIKAEISVFTPSEDI